MKPLIYPFENPTLTEGLASINATEPQFTVEPLHLKTWFNEGRIACYFLVDDIREMWNQEGLGAVFDSIFGETHKKQKLLAISKAGSEWTQFSGKKIDFMSPDTQAGGNSEADMLTYGVFTLDEAEDLYRPQTEDGAETPNSSWQHDASKDASTPPYAEAVAVNFPMPEPVLPILEAKKIYALVHDIDSYSVPTSPREKTTSKQCRVIVALLEACGITEEDMKGSIPSLQVKIGLKTNDKTTPGIDKKTWTDWLQKAGVR
ncbi:hypothetical protein AAH678_01955 [Sodalis endosymbiont of Spalangia cameroni]|uniref:hypothetical protein n=1 Tax=Sodalis praecaptivus TaxID=1239307 RepID=UPI0031F9782B